MPNPHDVGIQTPGGLHHHDRPDVHIPSIFSSRLNLVHDWLTGFRGGEKCLEVLCRNFPKAKLYTLLHTRGALPPTIEEMDIRTSFLQCIPRIDRYYRYTLPLMPFAASWRVADCDLLVSFSHAVAKAARAPSGVPHVCYCFTPMRYAWHMRESYFGGRIAGLKYTAVEVLMSALRSWDKRVSNRVTHFVAISETIQNRIRECYGRDSVVIYPPVDTGYYTPDPTVAREDYYLCVSAFAPYKRLDLAIQACNLLGKRLVVIGTGQDNDRLRSLAGPTIEFAGFQSDETIRGRLRRCRALLFPGEEDFGIVPVEANACGTPVVAFAKGGATETVRPLNVSGPTGSWFSDQTVDCLVEAIKTFERERDRLDPGDARRQAEKFDKRIFESQFLGYLNSVLGVYRNSLGPRRTIIG